MHYLEMTMKEMHELIVADGKAKYGAEYHYHGLQIWCPLKIQICLGFCKSHAGICAESQNLAVASSGPVRLYDTEGWEDREARMLPSF